MAFNAGNAFITVSPDMSKFQSDIKAQMAKQGDEAGKSFGDAFQARVKASFANLPNAKITADADTAKAKADLDAAAKDRTAKIKVSVDKAGLKSLALPALAIGGASALGPSALGLAAGVTGLGAAFAAAGAAAGAFGVIAKPMFTDVTTAQKALTKAQQDYAKADNSADRLKALQEEKAATDGLTPSEQQLLTQLTALEGAWKKLGQAEQPVVERALTPWLQGATSGMQLLTPLIEDGAGAFQLLGSEAKDALGSQFWGTFSNTLGTTGQIALVNFGEALGKVADGLAHLFVTFAPDIDQVIPLVNQAAGAFDKWAKSVTSQGLEDFFAKTFSPANVAALKSDLGNLATIVGNIAKAGAELSPTAFSGLSNLLTVLAKLSPGQIEALGVLYGVSKAVGGAGNLAKLASGGASLDLSSIGIPGVGGKSKKKTAVKGTAKMAAAAEEEVPAKAGKLAKAGKVAGGVAKAVPAVAAVSALDQAIPRGPGGEWVNSWAPYEKIFTNDLPKAWSISYEAFQVEFAGPMTNWFTDSLPHFFTSVIPSDIWSPAYEGFQSYFAGPLTGFFTNVLPGFFTNVIPSDIWSPAYEGFEQYIGSPVASFFTSTLPGFFTNVIPADIWSPAYEGFMQYIGSPVANFFTSTLPAFFTTAVPGAWDWAFQGFMTAVGSPVANWFTTSVPHFFTSAVPAAWDWAYQGFTTAVGTPVANWFSVSVPHFFTSAVPSAWSWAWTGFTSAVGTPVSNWFASSVPHFFTSAVPSAWSWAWTGFSSTVGTPVSNWFSSSLTSFVTRSIPGAFSSLWSSFSSAVVSPIENFFSSTLPGLASSANSLIGSAISLVTGGHASGTPSSPPGWFWVGEKGPELMRFRGGEQVLNHTASLAKAQSMASLASMNVPAVSAAPRLPGVSSPLSGGQLQMQVTYAGPSGDAVAAIVQGLQFHIQGTTGGDVQAALGQGPVRVTS